MYIRHMLYKNDVKTAFCICCTIVIVFVKECNFFNTEVWNLPSMLHINYCILSEMPSLFNVLSKMEKGIYIVM